MKDVGAIYLYRFAEGEHPVRRFIQSYREHPAGLAHDFHVIFKGFQDQSHLEHCLSLFADIPINSIVLADTGYDIGSYVQAAQAVSNERLIFFNTFSQILADGWLAHFSRASNLPGVGLVVQSGSAFDHQVMRSAQRYYIEPDSSRARNDPKRVAGVAHITPSFAFLAIRRQQSALPESTHPYKRIHDQRDLFCR